MGVSSRFKGRGLIQGMLGKLPYHNLLSYIVIVKGFASLPKLYIYIIVFFLIAFPVQNLIMYQSRVSIVHV